MKTVRSFIALNIDVATVRSIAKWQRDFRAQTDAAGLALQWVPPQNMHVTLRFLGPITEPMIALLKDRVSMLTRRLAPIDFSVQNLGFFPDADQPRVLYAGIDDATTALQSLYRDISDVLSQTGFQAEERPYVPHVTVARLSPDAGAALQPMCDEQGDIRFGASTAKEVLCYASDLSARRADYRLLWTLPLQGKPTAVASDTDTDGNAPPTDPPVTTNNDNASPTREEPSP